jgi:ATP-dependent DNA helicase RecQ
MILRGDLSRESLSLQTISLETKAERMAWLDEHLHILQGNGIIYTLTVKDAENLTEWLREQGHNVACYTGDELSENKIILEQKLIANEIKALVATTALGMGFDKPDLSFVIHFSNPSFCCCLLSTGWASRSSDSVCLSEFC